MRFGMRSFIVGAEFDAEAPFYGTLRLAQALGIETRVVRYQSLRATGSSTGQTVAAMAAQVVAPLTDMPSWRVDGDEAGRVSRGHR